MIPYLDRDATPPPAPGWKSWHEALASAGSDLDFAQLPFDHPLYILYSSGTTGVPKCIVHGAGGTLLQHVKEHVLHTDLRRDDRLFYFTTTGWMMWNWLVSALASEVTVVLFDGSPFAPTERILWDLAEQERVTVFGTSAKYIAALEKAGASPRQTHRLDSLRPCCRPARHCCPRVSTTCIARSKRTLPVVDLGRHRHRVVLRARRADVARVSQ